MMNNISIFHSLPPVLSSSDWVAIDLELFGAVKYRLHRPNTGTFACLSICALSNPEKVYVLLSKRDVDSALKNINDAVWVFHNANFDITHLRRWADIPARKKLWDVMIIERIMGGGLYNGDQFSLEDVVRRRLNLRMRKEIRSTFEKTNKITNEQILYAAYDAYVTLLACENQKTQIGKSDYKVWTDIDRKALWAMLDFQGFRIDTNSWKELATNNQAKADEIKANLPINPSSPTQVKPFLSKLGFKRLQNTREKELKNMIIKYPDTEASEYAKKILEYRTYAKRASTYGLKFVNEYVEKEKDIEVIHAGYWVIGAETGRTSSNSPNMQNIPIRDTNAFRKCFIAGPGNKLVIVDMGQQETRIAAYKSQDAKLIEILNNAEEDVFVGMARTIYKRNINKSDPFRKQVKNTVYGILYGMSAQGMSDEYRMSVEEAQKAINELFNTFPDLYSWITQQQKEKEYVQTIFGRKIWLNPYSDQVCRNAINFPIQGTAADQMKMALGNIYEKWPSVMGNIPFCCVGYIHDELIFDIKETQKYKLVEFVSKEMISAAETQCPGVRFFVSAQVCDNWAEKD
jgi:DNA polymerase-1